MQCCYTVFFLFKLLVHTVLHWSDCDTCKSAKISLSTRFTKFIKFECIFFLFCFGCLLALCNVHFISMNLSRSDQAEGRWVRGIRTADNEKLLHLLLNANRIEKMSVELIFNGLYTHNFLFCLNIENYFEYSNELHFELFWEFNENVWFKLIPLSDSSENKINNVKQQKREKVPATHFATTK